METIILYCAVAGLIIWLHYCPGQVLSAVVGGFAIWTLYLIWQVLQYCAKSLNLKYISKLVFTHRIITHEANLVKNIAKLGTCITAHPVQQT